ncbi:DNA-directed RNA polymerase specialized sigma24 family protein [Nitrobacteraceae bacterium AZCC 1564]
MSTFKEPWAKLRSNGKHLTPRELEFVRNQYRLQISAREVAKALRCSRRSISIHFRRLKDAGVKRLVDQRPPMVERKPTSARFYKGNFDLEVSA